MVILVVYSFVCLTVTYPHSLAGESKGIPIWITDFFQVRGKDDVQKFRSSDIQMFMLVMALRRMR